MDGQRETMENGLNLDVDLGSDSRQRQSVCLCGPQCFQPRLCSQTEVMNELNAFRSP